MPAFGGECEDELLLYSTDTAHYCDDTIVNLRSEYECVVRRFLVMDLEIITQEWHHKETFQADMETLKQEKIIVLYKSR